MSYLKSLNLAHSSSKTTIFKVPSSAVSMPSLTLDETTEEEGGGQAAGESAGSSSTARPGERTPGGLEKSASSASIVRARGETVVRLGNEEYRYRYHVYMCMDTIGG